MGDSLSSVYQSAFKRFWKDEFDTTILKIWRDRGSWVRCIWVTEFKQLLGDRYEGFLDYAKNHLRNGETKFNPNDIGRYAIIRLRQVYKIYEDRDHPIKEKTCGVCKSQFNAVDVSPSYAGFPSDQIKVCTDCFHEVFQWESPTSHMTHWVGGRTRKEMLGDLKALSKLFDNSVPPLEAWKAKGVITPSNHVEVVKLLMHMAPRRAYRKEFGSYFQALVEAGLLPEATRKLSRGTQCLANDGHVCLSIAEKKIDDWLSKHGIKHEKEPKYPPHRDLNQKSLLRADWRIGEYYVEFFGLAGQKSYDNKILLKRELATKKHIPLIEIHPSDIGRLPAIFRSVLGTNK